MLASVCLSATFIASPVYAAPIGQGKQGRACDFGRVR
jgi:hypothetical protein